MLSVSRLALAALAALALLPAAAAAQAPIEVPADRPGFVEFEHDGVNTVGYRLYVDGNEVGQAPVAARTAAGSVRMPVTLARGPRTVTVIAYGLDYEGPPAELKVVAKQPAPNAPKGLRFVLVASQQADGSFSLKLESVSPTE